MATLGGDLQKAVWKYLAEGLAIALAVKIIPKQKMSNIEILTIGLTGAVMFLILDLYAPSVGIGTRSGVGLGLGSQLVGGIQIAGSRPSEGFDGNAGIGGKSERNSRLQNLQSQMLSNEASRGMYGGVLHNPGTYVPVNANENNYGKAIKNFSESLKYDYITKLNQMGRVGR